MTLKQFHIVRIVVTIALSAVIAMAVLLELFYLALAGVISALLLLFIVKKQVKEIIVDERDYEIAGKSARWALSLFSVLASIVTFFLLFFREINPYYEIIGSTLAYSVCFLLIMYSMIFKSYELPEGVRRKKYFVVAFLITFFLTIVGARLLSGEDDWICQNGKWVKHGQPSFPAPSIECKE